MVLTKDRDDFRGIEDGLNTSLVYLIIVSKLNNFLTDKERHWAAFAILTNNVFRCTSISLFEVVSQ